MPIDPGHAFVFGIAIGMLLGLLIAMALRTPGTDDNDPLGGY